MNDAVLALQQKIEEVFKRTYGLVVAVKKAKFRDFSESYLENYTKPNKKSWPCDEYCLNAHMIPHFGPLDLRDIGLLQIEEYQSMGNT
jgi:hypothetical protein